MLNNTFFKVSLKSWSNTLTCIASAWLYELWKDIFKWKADFHEILFSFIHLFFHGKMNQFPKLHDFNSVTKLLTIKYSTFYANLANLFIRQKLQTFYWFLHFWKNIKNPVPSGNGLLHLRLLVLARVNLVKIKSFKFTVIYDKYNYLIFDPQATFWCSLSLSLLWQGSWY